jgi:daunorubicin resistance ABC transporter ATP-binding subunit
MTIDAIRAEGLVKRYGKHVALTGLDLTVGTGRVIGMLGHNGAGKTTLVRILSTLIDPDAGWARVAGHDLRTEAGKVRESIALAGQYAAVDEMLTGRQNLRMIARLRHSSTERSRRVANELLERFRLDEAADRTVGTYSGGMRRRLDLAACLVTIPKVLFLDEPTTGLDPASRLDLWASVRQLVEDGVSVLLTTQYLEEADILADSIVVLNAGAKVAEGTASELKERFGQERVVVMFDRREDYDRLLSTVRRWPGTAADGQPERLEITVDAPNPLRALADMSRMIERAGIGVRQLSLRNASLDEVFLSLTDR